MVHEELRFGEPDGLVGAGLIASRDEIDGPPMVARVGGAVVFVAAVMVVSSSSKYRTRGLAKPSRRTGRGLAFAVLCPSVEAATMILRASSDTPKHGAGALRASGRCDRRAQIGPESGQAVTPSQGESCR